MHQLFNPKRFMRIADALFLPILIIGLLAVVAGLYHGLIASPIDYQQGESVRIMYIHVPAAWIALMVYMGMALFSGGGFIWKNPFGFVLARAIAPIGAVFTLVCLITGSLWGKPTWGTWWVWDARLTSMLILLFLYLGYMALASAFEPSNRGEKSAGILCIVGVIIIPIIKFSVEWWNTLHQPASIIRSGGVAIDSSMLTPLLLMFLACLCFAIVLGILRIKTLLNLAKLERMRYQ